MPGLCSGVESNCQIVPAVGAQDGPDTRRGVRKNQHVINLDASILQLVTISAGDLKPPETEYARNGANVQRIRNVMQGACGCTKGCYRHFSVNAVAQICGLFWSLGAMEQEHLVRPSTPRHCLLQQLMHLPAWMAECTCEVVRHDSKLARHRLECALIT